MPKDGAGKAGDTLMRIWHLFSPVPVCAAAAVLARAEGAQTTSCPAASDHLPFGNTVGIMVIIAPHV